MSDLIGELDQHCGNCSISEYCGNPFGYCLCRDGRFSNMKESEYFEIAMTATYIKEFKACEDCRRPECESENEECEHNDEARDYYCGQVANYVENAMKGAAKANNRTCETCKWLYHEHCSNGESDKCTEMVFDDTNCRKWEGKDE